tara:strand:- start:15596 stop:15793 length:198 start_codon:yes stop_codon:yes gene_type:complete
VSKVSDKQIKLMRDNFKEDFDVLSLVSKFMYELTKAVKDFEDELDLMLNNKANKEFLEDTKDLPM